MTRAEQAQDGQEHRQIWPCSHERGLGKGYGPGRTT